MIIKTEEINEKIKSPAEFIDEGEERVTSLIKDCAEKILPSADTKPIILISGPSGSSKTTTAIKLAKLLRQEGAKVCYISMDKYLKNFTDEQKELKRRGKIDLESPDRVDMEYLNKDIDTLLNGGDIFIPTYDFTSNTRTLTDTRLNRSNGFVIIEGIHALNTDLMKDNDSFTNRIYVSVRTRVVDSNGDKLHPCKIRLMRRIIRDEMFRGRSVEETVKMFSNVQRGENKFIMPYKNRADFNIDTFIEYEPCIYKKYLYESLKALADEYGDLRDIVSALDEVEPLDDSSVPKDAFIREFIGGSSLSY